MTTKLTAKQDLFCKEYLKDLNATQAALRAGYSENTSRQIGTENLAKPAVAAKIAKLMSERVESVDIDSSYVLRRLKEIDQLDILDIMNDELDGFKRLSEWPKSWRISISGVDVQTIVSGGDESAEKLIKKIKWPDKTKNLDLIGKHVDVKAWDKEQEVTSVVHNIMPVPTAASAEDWESAAKDQQQGLLNHD